MKRLLIAASLLLAALPAWANTVYVTQSGTATGSCTGTIQTPAYFNTSSNWTSSTPTGQQIGPGTTVLVCGTFTSSVQGGNVLTVQGSGTSSNPITILFDTGAVMTSTGWWGSYNDSECPTCTGAVSVNSGNYIIVDGGTNGIIQNTLAGTSGYSGCSGGSCTQVPSTAGSVGVHVGGDYVIVRNLTIQGIYANNGSSSSATDTGGENTADIRVDGNATNVMIYNNTLFSARGGVWGGFNGSTGPNSCPVGWNPINGTKPAGFDASVNIASGVCIFDNTVSDHDWQMVLNSNGSNNEVNVYDNNIGDSTSFSGWLNWSYPYHTDGLFIWGSGTNQVVVANAYNNYIHGDLGAGSPSGLIYCTNDSNSTGDGTGCTLTAFNNLLVSTGYGLTHDQAMAAGLRSGDSISLTLYNNTIIGGLYGLEVYTGAGGTMPFVSKNNIFQVGEPGTSTGYYYNADNGSTWLTSLSAAGNVYYNGNGIAWQYNNSTYGSLSAWRAACSCDPSPTVVGAPNLNASYVPNTGSPAIGIGSNLTGSLNPLDSDLYGIARPSSGSWDAGAARYVTSSGAAPGISIFLLHP